MNGWEKCDELKKIRKQVAEANGIPYEIEPCKHLEDCIGTCPKCDAEIEYLMQELMKKDRAGQKIILDGIAGDKFQGKDIDVSAAFVSSTLASSNREDTRGADTIESYVDTHAVQDNEEDVHGGFSEPSTFLDRVDVPLMELNLSMRPHNCLMRAGIDTLQKLKNLTIEELQEIEDIGDKAIQEVLAKLREKGCGLREQEILMGAPVVIDEVDDEGGNDVIADGGIGYWPDVVDNEGDDEEDDDSDVDVAVDGGIGYRPDVVDDEGSDDDDDDDVAFGGIDDLSDLIDEDPLE